MSECKSLSYEYYNSPSVGTRQKADFCRASNYLELETGPLAGCTARNHIEGKHNLNPKARAMLYRKHILTMLTYASPSWATAVPCHSFSFSFNTKPISTLLSQTLLAVLRGLTVANI